MKKIIIIIDYDIGNLKSVLKAFQFLDIPVKLSREKEEIENADGLVLPGVGAFGQGMNNLARYGLESVIKNTVKRGVPLLGICLGMQLLFTKSEESPGIEGLSQLAGTVRKFSRQKVNKIPHMGWNQLDIKQDDPLFKDIADKADFYFVHSYFAADVCEKQVIARTVYGQEEFVSVVRKDNLWGIQCHPEKSSQAGLKFLENFSEVVFNGSNSSS